MYQLIFGSHFLHSAKKLDKDLRSKLKIGLDILLKDPFYPTLHTKPLTGRFSHYYSFRLGRDYRVTFRFSHSSAIHLIDIGHRKDIYRS